MAKFWPLHHYNQCMGENRRKHLAQLVGEGACQPVIFTKYRLGCELSYGTCIHSFLITATVNLYYLYCTNKMADLITPTIRIWARI